MEKKEKISWKKGSIESRPRLKTSCKSAVNAIPYFRAKQSTSHGGQTRCKQNSFVLKIDEAERVHAKEGDHPAQIMARYKLRLQQ